MGNTGSSGLDGWMDGQVFQHSRAGIFQPHFLGQQGFPLEQARNHFCHRWVCYSAGLMVSENSGSDTLVSYLNEP